MSLNCYANSTNSTQATLPTAIQPVLSRSQRSSGWPLPSSYVELLRHLGASWGVEHRHRDHSLERLCSYYETFDWRPIPGLTLIACDNYGNSEDYFIDTRGGGDPVVCASVGTVMDDIEPEAPSLAAYLFELFFALRYLPRQAFVINSSKVRDLDGAFSKAVSIAEAFGLRAHPRSENGHVYLLGDGIAAMISQPPGYGLGVTIGGTKQDKVERLYALLDDHVGLVRGR